MRDTAKILINIASTEYMQDENAEALRYYKHAMSVLKNCDDFPSHEITQLRQQPPGNDRPDLEFVLRPE